MRGTSETRLNATWYGGHSAPIWLRALVPLYRVGQKFDRWRKPPSEDPALGKVFIIVVGNITVGGAGKTPLVIRLCQLLREQGIATAVISRGYGRQEKGMRLVSPGSDPKVVGDEPLLIARDAVVPVLVSSDRCEAALKLVEKGAQVIISDDGLQHYRLPRNLEICVLDGKRGVGNGQLLPAGPLREAIGRLATVDYRVVNGELSGLPAGQRQMLEAHGALHTMHLVAGYLRALDNGQAWRLAQFSGCKVNAVAGIGNPDRFFELLRHSRIQVVEHAFPDHHQYQQSDFESMDKNLPVLMTEKDAVKCRGLNLKNAWVLAVDAVMPAEWEQSVVNRIRKFIGEREAGSQQVTGA